MKQVLTTEDQLIALAGQLARRVPAGSVIYLEGPLGAGKTTFSRGFLRGLGHQGRVKSPTYTLVEPYELAQVTVYHFDLYRLADAEELEFMGIRDYFGADTIALVEWPCRGQGILPAADLQVRLDYHPEGRHISLQALTAKGRQILQQMT